MAFSFGSENRRRARCLSSVHPSAVAVQLYFVLLLGGQVYHGDGGRRERSRDLQARVFVVLLVPCMESFPSVVVSASPSTKCRCSKEHPGDLEHFRRRHKALLGGECTPKHFNVLRAGHRLRHASPRARLALAARPDADSCELGCIYSQCVNVVPLRLSWDHETGCLTVPVESGSRWPYVQTT